MLSLSFSVFATSKINLYSSDSSYSDILKNPIKAKESDDSYISLLRLVPDTFHLRLMPFTRAMKYIKHRDEPACVLFAGKTKQRMNDYWFSLPLAVLPPLHLYQKLRDSELDGALLNKQNEVVSLKSLMNSNKSHSLVVAQGISYGDKLDSEIESLPESQVYRIALFSADNPVYEVLANRNINYALMYPSALNAQNMSKLRSYKIEGVGDYSGNHIVCNRTEETKEWLSMVNTKLTKLYHSLEFLQQVLAHAPAHSKASLTTQLLSLSNS